MTDKTYLQISEGSVLTFTDIEENVEMLKITPSGFYVRGEKVKQDEYEAQLIYNTFTEWLFKAGKDLVQEETGD